MSLKRKRSVCNCRVDSENVLFPFHLAGRRRTKREAELFWELLSSKLFEFLAGIFHDQLETRQSIRMVKQTVSAANINNRDARILALSRALYPPSEGWVIPTLTWYQATGSATAIEFLMCSGNANPTASTNEVWNSRMAEFSRLSH